MSDIDRSGTLEPRYVPASPWGPGSAVAVAIVAALAPAFLVFALVALVVGVDAETLADAHSLASPVFLSQMVLGQFFSLAIIWFAAGRGGQRASVLRLNPAEETPFLTAAGLGLVLIAAIAPIELLLYRLAGLELFTDGRWLLDGLRSDYWWGVVIVAVVLAPLWEELVFRGFLLSALAKTRLGFWPAAAVSSLLWTTLHAGYSWPGLVSVFLAGIGLSWIMQRTGSMRAVVIAHAVINAFAILAIWTFAH